MENRCVCCGEIIPEGRQVCERCLNTLTFDEDPGAIGGWIIRDGDLISRSALQERIEYYISHTIENTEANYAYKKMAVELSQIPMAFNKEKVINELEELRMQYFLTIANTGDEKLDCAYEYVSNALDYAVKIIEKGGI